MYIAFGSSLEELNANFNMLTMLPNNIGFELINLKKLSVNSNKLIFLPKSITYLTFLRFLDARLNCLRSLPDDLDNLMKLEVLNVSQNFQYLENLPYSIGHLDSLVELDVSYNNITSLPDTIGYMKKLRKLCVEGNPLVSPPMEVFELSLHAVKEYLSDKMNAVGRKSPQKKTSWVGKLVKYGNSNGGDHGGVDRERFIISEYRSIESLASPRYMGIFSPRRIFSPRTYFTR